MYQEGDTKKIPHLRPKNIRCYCTKFSCHDSLAPVMYIILQCVQKYFNNCHRIFGTVIWFHLNQNGRSLEQTSILANAVFLPQ